MTSIHRLWSKRKKTRSHLAECGSIETLEVCQLSSRPTNPARSHARAPTLPSPESRAYHRSPDSSPRPVVRSFKQSPSAPPVSVRSGTRCTLFAFLSLPVLSSPVLGPFIVPNVELFNRSKGVIQFCTRLTVHNQFRQLFVSFCFTHPSPAQCSIIMRWSVGSMVSRKTNPAHFSMLSQF